MEQKRTGYLDFLRVIACVMVVGVHVSALCLESLDVTSVNFKVMNGFDCFSILGVPLFVMLSGSLMLSEKHSCRMKDLYLKKIGRLVILYFVLFLFYNIVNFIESGTAWTFENVKQEIVLESLLGRGIYHLWFLPMIIALYLVTPFLKTFAADKGKCILFLVLYFCIILLVPTALKFEFPYKTIVASLYERFQVSFFGGYIGYYVLGHVLHEFLPELKAKALAAAALLGIFSFGTEVYVCNLYSERNGELSTILNDPITVNVFAASACIFVLCKHSKILPGDTMPEGGPKGCSCPGNRWLAKGARLTFGIYLLHPFVLHMFNLAGVDTLFAPAWVAVPAVVCLVTAVTAVLVYLLLKVPGIRSFL